MLFSDMFKLPAFGQNGLENKAAWMGGFSNELRTAKRTVRICILMAMVLVGLGINALVSEHASPFGRGLSGMLRQVLFTHFGAAGLAALWIALAMVPLFFARLIWRHTARAPRDRWWRN
ncbi:hypothetical protein [Pseudoduganella lutea]|uniref:Uncharacterized protein n=1 Tax=Pseudoduganella lutea TaxID=321985 RepID=A0A4P6L611_9BURK|nr:hypothetical protein [Pseudoduganella lutea]QBE66914.1 hypothetical protein EWM63_31335 [Pseudoduganella lutea]